jgi:hypothetical protein
LEFGIEHFKKKKVVGVAGYTLPHKKGTIWEKLFFDWGWRKMFEISGYYLKDNFFSTTNCILKKKLWKQYPFDENLPKEILSTNKYGGEDYDWGLEMIARGYNLIVEPQFDVYHSHRENILDLASKYIAWQRIRKKLRSRKRPRNSFSSVFKKKIRHYEL